jgi:hypothetical protein
MATRKEKSIIGEYRGSIGPVVFTNSLGGATAKSQPKKRGKNSLNAAQMKHTGPFSRLNEFLQHATDVINLGYQLPRNAGMSRFNAAVKWHFEEALADDQEKAVIDFPKLKLSSPIKSTQKAWEPSLSVDDTHKMTVSWKLNPLPKKCTQLSDKAIIVVHFEHRGISRFMCYKDAVRRDLTFTKELPFLLKGKHVNCYMFMVSADKKLVSETQYLGAVQLKS